MLLLYIFPEQFASSFSWLGTLDGVGCGVWYARGKYFLFLICFHLAAAQSNALGSVMLSNAEITEIM